MRQAPFAIFCAVLLVALPSASAAPGKCAAAQLKAASRLAQAILKCHAKDSNQPALGECLEKGRVKFRSAYAKAVERYSDCELIGQVDQVIEESFVAPSEDLVSEILQNSSPSDPDDVALRAALIQGAGSLEGKRLSAWAGWVNSSNALNLVRALLKAESKFIGSAEKAIENGANRGVVYDGLSIEDILSAVEQTASQFVGDAAGVRQYSVSGISSWSGCRDPFDDGGHFFSGEAFFSDLGGGPVEGFYALLTDGASPEVGDLSGDVSGNVLTAELRYSGSGATGTGSCVGNVGNTSDFTLDCEGQDRSGDTCAWDAADVSFGE